MSDTKPNPIIRVFPSLTDVAFVLPMIFMVWQLGGASRMLEGDTGWHIRTGQWILENGRVPDKDMFSFTKFGEPWFAWEWLWDLVFGWLHHIGGLPAVVFASLLVLCFTSVLLFRLVRRSCPNVFIAFAVTWFALATTSIHWWARPHVFTFLFALTFLHVLERAESGKRYLLWLLPFLMAIWTNVHGGFIVGLILIGAYLTGNLIRALLASDSQERTSDFVRVRAFASVLLASALATFLNPYGYELHRHVGFTLTDPESPLYRFVGEWQPLSLRGPLALYVEPLLVAGIAAAAWQIVNRRFTYALLVLAFMHASFVAFRNLPIFVLVAAPGIANMLHGALQSILESSTPHWLKRTVASFTSAAADFGQMDGIRRVHVTSALAVVLFALGLFARSPLPTFRAEYDSKRYPVALVNKLGTGISDSLFVQDEWGDYLIYRLYPAKKVYVDGRFDLYGGKFTESYIDITNGKYDWERKLGVHRIDQVLLMVETPLVSTLKESARWQVVYDDGLAILFSRRPISNTAPASVAATDDGKPRSQSAPNRQVLTAQLTD